MHGNDIVLLRHLGSGIAAVVYRVSFPDTRPNVAERVVLQDGNYTVIVFHILNSLGLEMLDRKRVGTVKGPISPKILSNSMLRV